MKLKLSALQNKMCCLENSSCYKPDRRNGRIKDDKRFSEKHFNSSNSDENDDCDGKENISFYEYFENGEDSSRHKSRNKDSGGLEKRNRSRYHSHDGLSNETYNYERVPGKGISRSSSPSRKIPKVNQIAHKNKNSQINRSAFDIVNDNRGEKGDDDEDDMDALTTTSILAVFRRRLHDKQMEVSLYCHLLFLLSLS